MLYGLPDVEVGFGTGLKVLYIQLSAETIDLISGDLSRAYVIFVAHKHQDGTLKRQFSNLRGPEKSERNGFSITKSSTSESKYNEITKKQLQKVIYSMQWARASSSPYFDCEHKSSITNTLF